MHSQGGRTEQLESKTFSMNSISGDDLTQNSYTKAVASRDHLALFQANSVFILRLRHPWRNITYIFF